MLPALAPLARLRQVALGRSQAVMDSAPHGPALPSFGILVVRLTKKLAQTLPNCVVVAACVRCRERSGGRVRSKHAGRHTWQG